jgi:hypothetical protein
LTILPVLPEGSARDKQEIELQLALGLSLFTAEGFVSAKAEQASTRAHELAEHRMVLDSGSWFRVGRSVPPLLGLFTREARDVALQLS